VISILLQIYRHIASQLPHVESTGNSCMVPQISGNIQTTRNDTSQLSCRHG